MQRRPRQQGPTKRAAGRHAEWLCLLLRRYCETSARDVVSVVGAFETALQDALQRAYGLDPLAVSAYAHNADNTHYACNGVRDLVDDCACAHSVVPKRRCHCATNAMQCC
jgi:hypothetical protein